jgi:hypothetical protein
VLDKGNLLRWHSWLVDALRVQYDLFISLNAGEGAVRLPASCKLAFELERLIYRIPPGAAIDSIQAEALEAPIVCGEGESESFDVAIDCTGVGNGAVKAKRTLNVLFNGLPGEIGALAALLDKLPICVSIEEAERPGGWATATPALSDRRVLIRAIDNACSFAIDLIAKAIRQNPLQANTRVPGPPSRAQRPSSAAGLAYVAASLAWKANRFLSLRLADREQWSVAYRRIDGAALIAERQGEFRLLADCGRSYYADPFVLRHRGRTALFMEEFSFNTMRGRIVVAFVEEDGSVSPPRPALEEDHHLSYPQVFEFDGEVWMVPESGANASIDLYRAVEFPFRWSHEATLLEGAAAYDATLVHDDAGWWMLAATRHGRGTGWDRLSIFHAQNLLGHWQACTDNPVVLDACAARPAGAVMSRFGARLRPVQDCGAYYGAAIGLWRIDRLDQDGFEQTQVAKIVSDDFGVHTYNAAYGLEVLDAFGKTRGRRTATFTCVSIPPTGQAASVDRGAALPGFKIAPI